MAGLNVNEPKTLDIRPAPFLTAVISYCIPGIGMYSLTGKDVQWASMHMWVSVCIPLLSLYLVSRGRKNKLSYYMAAGALAGSATILLFFLLAVLVVSRLFGPCC